jgi:predicted Zn-dependent protease
MTREAAASRASPGDLVFSARVVNLVRPMLLRNEDIVARVVQIGRTLVVDNQIDTTEHHFTFSVLIEPLPNAFSLPSGDVYVTTGLLNLLAGPDDLAAVLAREIALVDSGAFGRGVRPEGATDAVAFAAAGALASVALYFTFSPIVEYLRSDQVTPASQIAPLVFGGLVVLPSGLVSRSRRSRLNQARVAGELLMGRQPLPTAFDGKLLRVVYEGYESDVEMAADSRAVDLAARAGYDPGALVRVLENLHVAGGKGLSHLKSATPGIARRLAQLDSRGLKPAAPRRSPTEIWEDFH